MVLIGQNLIVTKGRVIVTASDPLTLPNSQLTIFTNQEGKGVIRTQESGSCSNVHNHSNLKVNLFIKMVSKHQLVQSTISFIDNKSFFIFMLLIT